MSWGFRAWLIKRREKRTRVGALAREAVRDDHFPDTDDWDELYAYVMEQAQGDDQVRQALMEAYLQYRAYQEKHRI